MLNELQQAINFENKRTTAKREAYSRDLRQSIETQVPKAAQQVAAIAHRFEGGNAEATAANIHKFIRSNFIYLQDSAKVQQVKLPSRILKDLTADCKSFSLFAASVLYALGYPVKFKYAAYREGATVPTHIYVVSEDTKGNEIILDGTSPLFNLERAPKYSFYKNLRPMRVEVLSDEDILAEEILALEDEELSAEAGRKFLKRVRTMGKTRAGRYLQKFKPHNRKKLMRSLNTAQKNDVLNRNQRKLQMQQATGVTAGLNAEVWSDTMQQPNFTSWSDSGPNVFFTTTDSSGLANEEYLASRKKQRPRQGGKGKSRTEPGKFQGRQGRQTKRAERATKKAASAKEGSLKQKRLQAKAAKGQAKASGDKEALKAARKQRRGVAKERAKKVGKFVAKINPVLAAGRGAFLAITALNLRGFATSIADAVKAGQEAPLKKKWEALGGKFDKLVKAANRGKNKKPLFGKKKGKSISDDYEEMLAAEMGVEYLADGGLSAGATALIAAAPVIAALAPILAKFLKKEGKDSEMMDASDEEANSPEAKTKFGKFAGKAKGFFDKVKKTVTGAVEFADEVEEKIREITNPAEAEEEGGTSASGGGMGMALPLLAGGGLLLFLTMGKKKK